MTSQLNLHEMVTLMPGLNLCCKTVLCVEKILCAVNVEEHLSGVGSRELQTQMSLMSR